MKKILLLVILFLQTALAEQKTWPSPETWPPQIVRWNLKGNKELIIVAVHHVDQLDSPTHQLIKRIFQEDKPDIYVMEGFCSEREGLSPERLKKKSVDICENVGKCGENLYAAYLATLNKVKFIGMEMSEKKQIPMLKEHGYSREDVIFYLLVQQLPYFYRDGDFKTHTEKFTPATWESMCQNFLTETIAGWIEEDVTLTYQDFLTWWQKRFNSPLDMEKEFSHWERGVLYHEPSTTEDALFSQKIAFWFHKNRDDYMFETIQDAVKHNQKILVIYGTNHLRDQWDQLIKAFGPPSMNPNPVGPKRKKL